VNAAAISAESASGATKFVYQNVLNPANNAAIFIKIIPGLSAIR
jgi:hypothetical protein